MPAKLITYNSQNYASTLSSGLFQSQFWESKFLKLPGGMPSYPLARAYFTCWLCFTCRYPRPLLYQTHFKFYMVAIMWMIAMWKINLKPKPATPFDLFQDQCLQTHPLAYFTSLNFSCHNYSEWQHHIST